MVSPTKSGVIVERRDQVLIGRLSEVARAASTLACRWWSTNGPFLIERAMSDPMYACRRREKPYERAGCLSCQMRTRSEARDSTEEVRRAPREHTTTQQVRAVASHPSIPSSRSPNSSESMAARGLPRFRRWPGAISKSCKSPSGRTAGNPRTTPPRPSSPLLATGLGQRREVHSPDSGASLRAAPATSLSS